MTDTVTRVMELADALAQESKDFGHLDNSPARQALQDELQQLFTPLSQVEVIDGFCKQPHDVQFVSVFKAGVRFAEQAHDIK